MFLCGPIFRSGQFCFRIEELVFKTNLDIAYSNCSINIADNEFVTLVIQENIEIDRNVKVIDIIATSVGSRPK